MFKSSKYHVQFQQKANVVYKIKCPGCFNKYVGRIDRNIITRIFEHGTKPDQPMLQVVQKLKNISKFIHFLKCS